MPTSAVDCVQPAIQHTRDQLFRPFRFGQWARLALVGILAAELSSGGCSTGKFHFPLSTHPHKSNRFIETSFSQINPSHFDPARIAQFAGLILALVFIAIILFFIFLYISSVFRFILFDSVLRKRCSISEGWQRWHRVGRKYFLWKIVFLIAQFLFLGVLIGVPLAVAAALGWFHDLQQHIARTILGALLLFGLILVFALLAGAVQILAKDFLVPVMALEEVDFADGWSRLLSLIRPEPGRFAVYLLLKFVLAIAAAILFGILAIIPIVILVAPAVVAVIAAHAAGMAWDVATVSLTVIIGSVLLVFLIYVIALVNVPATVFFPAFSIYFFAARYPRLDVLLNPPPPAPQLPPVLESSTSGPPQSEPPAPEPPLPPPDAEPRG